jgi:hypothetical protein
VFEKGLPDPMKDGSEGDEGGIGSGERTTPNKNNTK